MNRLAVAVAHPMYKPVTHEAICCACSRRGPDARSARTLAENGWRLRFTRDGGKAGIPDEGDYRWVCPACVEAQTGSAPLRR